MVPGSRARPQRGARADHLAEDHQDARFYTHRYRRGAVLLRDHIAAGDGSADGGLPDASDTARDDAVSVRVR